MAGTLAAIIPARDPLQSRKAEIKHRAEVEKALSMRERELADLFENATVGLCKIGPDGVILSANRADYELLGYAPAEYVGHSITEFHADSNVAGDRLKRLVRIEALMDVSARLRCKDGSIKHVLIDSSAGFEDGKFSYARCFTRDITWQIHAEQALREANSRQQLLAPTGQPAGRSQ